MLVSPMYALAFVFMFTTSILFLLWHFRAQILARVMPQDGLDIEIGRDYSLTSERAAGDYSTAAAPAFIISRLPVFKYPRKLRHSSSSSTSDTASDEGSAASGTVDTDAKAAAAAAGTAASREAEPGAPQQEQQEQRQEQQEQQAGYGSWIRKLVAGQQQQQQQEPVADTVTSMRDQQPSHSSAAAAATANATSIGCGISIHEASSNQQHKQQPQPQQQQQHEQQQRDAGLEQVASNASSSGGQESCIICFTEYVRGDLLKQLPCQHCYHAACIDRWLLRSGCCPLCKVHVWQPQQFMQRLDQLAQEATGLRPQQQQQQQRQQGRRSSSSSFESAVSAAAAVAAGGVAVAPSAVA